MRCMRRNTASLPDCMGTWACLAIRGEDATKEGEVKKLSDEVKGVIAGKDEQLDMLLLNRFINRCLPQPDGSSGWPSLHVQA